MAKSKDEFSQAALDDAYYEGAWMGTVRAFGSVVAFSSVMSVFGVAAALTAAPAVGVALWYGAPPIGRALHSACRRLG